MDVQRPWSNSNDILGYCEVRREPAKFFRSLVSFLSTYDFDGVDLDWEFPVAPDRNGRPEDYENFPKFMANLKSALKGTGGRDHLSITFLALYWYLQNFDLKRLSSSVDYINIMSYDLHGKWDHRKLSPDIYDIVLEYDLFILADLSKRQQNLGAQLLNGVPPTYARALLHPVLMSELWMPLGAILTLTTSGFCLKILIG